MQKQTAKQEAPNRLKALRTAEGLKLYDISALIRRDPSSVHRYETGDSEVPGDVMRILAKHYGVSVEHLMGWDSEPEATGAAA